METGKAKDLKQKKQNSMVVSMCGGTTKMSVKVEVAATSNSKHQSSVASMVMNGQSGR